MFQSSPPIASHRESLRHLQTRDCYKPHIRLYNSAGRGGYRICSTSRRGGAPKRRPFSPPKLSRLPKPHENPPHKTTHPGANISPPPPSPRPGFFTCQVAII